jgi:hypothetical protein
LRKSVVLITTLTLASFPVSAQATPEISDVTDPTTMMSPQLLAETNQDLPAPGSLTSGQVGDVLEQEVPGIAVDIADEAGEGTLLEPGEGQSGIPLEITAPFGDRTPTLESGVTVFADDQGQAATFVQPLDDGVRYLTSIASADAGESFAYEVIGGEAAYLQELPDGEHILLSAQNEYVPTLKEPWAIDSSGKDLATSYLYEGNTLTQVVVYEASTAFPVLAEPTWYYQIDHRSYNLITGKGKTSAYRVIPELNRCFNCSFPVLGAPSYFPGVGSRINLNASPFSLVNIAAPVQVSGKGSLYFSFLALSGLFDGMGSTVNFRSYNDASGWLHINVDAKVIVGRGAAANSVNRSMASQKWLDFLGRLIRRTGL